MSDPMIEALAQVGCEEYYIEEDCPSCGASECDCQTGETDEY